MRAVPSGFEGAVMSRSNKYLPFIFSVLAVMAVVSTDAAAEGMGHGSCADCHGENHSLKTPSATDLCLSCHPGGRADHPLMRIPDTMATTLPLDQERNMTCLTCHEPHGKGEGRKLLRKTNEALCQDCHQK